MIEFIFPFVAHTLNIKSQKMRAFPRDYVANPKAIAAQTYASDAGVKLFHESGVWELLSDFFTPQIECAPCSIPLPKGSAPWVAFPWTIADIPTERAVAVWVEQHPERKFIRHVRLFQREEYALKANEQIMRKLQSSSSVPPVPLQAGQHN